MRRWLRRLRGIAGIGTIWGGVGAFVATAVGLLGGVFGSVPISQAFGFGAGAGLVGFALGTGFATFFTMVESRRTLGELSVGRAALLGGLVGAATPLALTAVVLLPLLGSRVLTPVMALALASSTVAYGGLCALLAAGTVAIAKRAPDELEAGQDAPGHLLTDDESAG